MDTIKMWLMKFTPLQKLVDFFDGKKQMLASLGAALVATGTIVANYAERGTPYILHVASTVEFAAASVGWIGFFNALKGEKARAEVEALNEKIDAASVGQAAPPKPSSPTGGVL